MSNYNRRIGRKTKKKFKKSWDRVKNGLSRSIAIYQTGTESECPNCYYDKVNRSSSGVPKSSPGDENYFTTGRCPVCYGKGILTTVRRTYIKGIVIWNPSGDKMNVMLSGQPGLQSGTLVEIKTDPKYLNTLKTSNYIVVDGLKCKLATPPILRGIGSQQILVAHFFSDDKSDPDSGESL